MNQQNHDEYCKVSPVVRCEIKQAMHRADNILFGVKLGFVPWIGNFYGNSEFFGQKRILVLGVSHYEWCKACRNAKRGQDLTCRCVAEVLFSEPSQHWLKIQYALTGEKANDAESRKRFWHSVAYYNYIPEIVGYWDKENQDRSPAPTAEMWDEAEKFFLKVISQIKPDLVVVLGYTLWDELPLEDKLLSTLIAGDKQLERCSYSNSIGSEKPVVACRVRNTAAGLGLPWHPVLKKCISTL